MIKEFVDAWYKNKGALEKHLSEHNQSEYSSYEELVKLLFNIVINPATRFDDVCYVTDDIHCIDDGDYQGTQLFLLHTDTYQPCIEDYVCTHVYYGSCSGCDTLLSISHYEDDRPNKKQVDEYMTLCLHLLQRCRRMVDGDREDS